jgi:hypothetical protein
MQNTVGKARSTSCPQPQRTPYRRRTANSRSRQPESSVGVLDDGESSHGSSWQTTSCACATRWPSIVGGCGRSPARSRAPRSRTRTGPPTRCGIRPDGRMPCAGSPRHLRGRARSALARIGCCTWCRPAAGGPRRRPPAAVSRLLPASVRLQRALAAAQGRVARLTGSAAAPSLQVPNVLRNSTAQAGIPPICGSFYLVSPLTPTRLDSAQGGTSIQCPQPPTRTPSLLRLRVVFSSRVAMRLRSVGGRSRR